MVSSMSIFGSSSVIFGVVAAFGVVSSFASSFTAQTMSGEMVVNDSKTGLVWQQNTADTNDDGSITSTPYPKGDTMKWQAAKDYCENLEYAGLSGWRLPDFKELTTLVDVIRSYPAIDKAFQCESHYYWSASTHETDVNEARYVHFNFGSDHWKPKDKNAFVRCVRNDT